MLPMEQLDTFSCDGAPSRKGRPVMKRFCSTTGLVLSIAAGVMANPTPGPDEAETSLLQTVEAVFQLEGPVGEDSAGIWILYGGPTLVYVWRPEDARGAGLGLELGGEIRKSFLEPFSGPFMSAYLGVGALWRNEEETSEAVSGGVKLGWRIPLLTGAVLLDLEPYAGAGIRLFSLSDPEGSDFGGGMLYLGLKLGFH